MYRLFYTVSTRHAEKTSGSYKTLKKNFEKKLNNVNSVKTKRSHKHTNTR